MVNVRVGVGLAEADADFPEPPDFPPDPLLEEPPGFF